MWWPIFSLPRFGRLLALIDFGIAWYTTTHTEVREQYKGLAQRYAATMTRQKYVPWAKFMSLLNELKCMHCSTPKIWLLLGVSCNANCGLWINISLQQFMKNNKHSLLQITSTYTALYDLAINILFYTKRPPAWRYFFSTQLVGKSHSPKKTSNIPDVMKH